MDTAGASFLPSSMSAGPIASAGTYNDGGLGMALRAGIVRYYRDCGPRDCSCSRLPATAPAGCAPGRAGAERSNATRNTALDTW